MEKTVGAPRVFRLRLVPEEMEPPERAEERRELVEMVGVWFSGVVRAELDRRWEQEET